MSNNQPRLFIRPWGQQWCHRPAPLLLPTAAPCSSGPAAPMHAASPARVLLNKSMNALSLLVAALSVWICTKITRTSQKLPPRGGGRGAKPTAGPDGLPPAPCLPGTAAGDRRGCKRAIDCLQMEAKVHRCEETSRYSALYIVCERYPVSNGTNKK